MELKRGSVVPFMTPISWLEAFKRRWKAFEIIQIHASDSWVREEEKEKEKKIIFNRKITLLCRKQMQNFYNFNPNSLKKSKEPLF